MRRVKKQGVLHFAWDRVDDEALIVEGLKILKEAHITGNIQIYVLVGFPKGRHIDSSDLHRCQVIADHGFDPFIMILDNIPDRQLHQFRRMTNRAFTWRNEGFSQAWANYGPRKVERR